MRRDFGADHAFVVIALGGVGVTLEGQERHDEAQTILEEALTVSLDVYGEDAPRTEWVRGLIEWKRSRAAKAEETVAAAPTPWALRVFDRELAGGSLPPRSEVHPP